MAEKTAFIHFAKCAGRYVDWYLQRNVFRNSDSTMAEQQTKVFNSWGDPFAIERDWTEKELLQLALNRYPAQRPTPDEVRMHHSLWKHDYLARQYVHNHHHNWTTASVLEFRKNGWFTFMFIREPADLLCSLWTWVQKNSQESAGARSVIQPTWLATLSLDQFIQAILANAKFSVFYGLPEYVDAIEYVEEFTNENFSKFLLRYFSHRYQTGKREADQHFRSGNPGYHAYTEQGLISRKSQELLRNNPEICRVRERLTSLS